MASQVTLKALGLNYSPNNLALPEGSLVVADDVIIRRDNVIESRRGFGEYSEQFGTANDHSKQLFTYKNRILNHYSNVLQFDTGTFDSNGKAILDDFYGTYQEVETGLRIKSIEANKNLYFTTDKGIKKIAARTAADFTSNIGFVKDAGAVKALDFSATLDISQGQTSGFLPVDSVVAYRILWGYKDLNDNLILGAPSDSISVYNYLSNIVSLDLNTFLIALDNCVQNTSSYYSVLHNSTTYGTQTFGASESFSSKFKVNINDDATVYAANLNSTAQYMDQFATLGDSTATYTFTVSALGTQTQAGAIYTDALSGNTFTVTTTANVGATSLICTGTGDPAYGISGTTNLTYTSGTGQSPTIAYSAYAKDSTKAIPYNKPLQINNDKTYTFTVSALSSSVTAGTIYRESTSGAIFVANAASNGATTFTAVGSNTPSAVTGLNSSLTLTRISGSGGPATITYTEFTSTQAGFSSISGLGSIDFTLDPSTVFTAGDLIEITGAADGNNNNYSFTLNKRYTFTLSSAASVPTFSTFTSNGQTFTVMPFSSPLSHTFTFTAGTPVANDVYGYTEPSTGYTYRYTFLTGTTANGLAFPAITAGGTITLTRISGTGSATLTCNSIRLTTTSTTLICTGTGAPTAPGAATSGTLTYGIKTFTITSNTIANPTVVTTSTAHGLYTGETVTISGSNSNPVINGTYTATVTGANTFTVPVNVTTTAGTAGTGVNTTAFAFTAYTQSDPVVSTSSVYTNNSQRFTTSSFTNLTTLASVGTGAPNAITSTTLLSLFSGNGDTVLQYSAFTRGTSSYTSFNNTITSTNTSKYWTITSVDATNKKIYFNLTSTATIPSGSAGTSVKLLSYNYRNIVETGDTSYSTPLSDLVVSTPPTSEQLRIIQNTLTRIAARLKNEKTGYISANAKSTYIQNYSTTSYANVSLNITIPTTINSSDYFLQVYRTRNFTATGGSVLGVDVTPDDEMRLVYEAFPVTALNISSVSATSPATITTSVSHGLTSGTVVNISGTNTSPSTEGSFVATVTGTNTFTIPVAVASVTTGTGIVTFPQYYSFVDQYPEALRDNNVNLYTNPVTGEGISQANDIPPIAKDVSRFKNVVFYANTKTRHRLNPFQLLGTSAISSGDTITISNGVTTSIYQFTLGVQEVTSVVFKNNPPDATTVTPANLLNKYFSIYSAQDETAYYVWFRVDNAGVDPAISGKTGIRVDLLTGDSVGVIRDKTLNAINAISLDFICTTNGSYGLNITNTNYGITTNSSDGNIGASYITISTTTQGDGENATSTPPKVLLSKPTSTVTASQAIDETARSLVRIINQQSSSTVNAYYISSSTSLPGQINLESKSINDVAFYIQASNAATGASFNPNIEPYNIDTNTIQRLSGTQVQFTTTAPHGLINGDNIMISLATVPTGQYLNGIYTVANVPSSTSFVINKVTTAFATASYPFVWSKLSDVSVSNNETKPNRVYYSKLSQPEAVPLLNYFDIGSSDQNILRIFPLRDSLFVFKEDGLYRISGEVAPFVVTLFDSSCVLIAPDTVSVANNIIYGWTNKGISNVTEAGVTEVSRPIDTVILKLASANYVNFPRASWGLGYDSDNSYTVYTCANTDDTVATVAFRFSNLTNTWTNFQRSQTCGTVNLHDDKIYAGSGTYNLIDQERKNFNRTDYSDRDFTLSVTDNFLNNGNITISSTTDVEVGDVITQTQGLTIYKFNALLDKLDLDSSVGQYGYNVSTLGTTTITINTTIVNTSTPKIHSLSTGDWINIDSSNTVPSIDGEYQITYASPTAFTIQIPEALVTGTTGTSNKLTRNYSKSLPAVTGDNLRVKLLELASYLDTDPSLTPPVGVTYSSIIANKTGTISTVNNTNPGTINTSSAHQIIDGRVVTISGTNTVIIPSITGDYIIDVSGTFPSNFTSTSFLIPVNITTGQTVEGHRIIIYYQRK
jgi:hypothetical protein